MKSRNHMYPETNIPATLITVTRERARAMFTCVKTPSLVCEL